MATPEPSEEAIQVPVVWVGADDLPVQFVNQFLGLVEPNEIFLMLGTLVPPPIMGETVEDRRAQAESIPFIQIKPVARVAMTAERLRQLIDTLQQTLTNYENQQKMRPQ